MTEKIESFQSARHPGDLASESELKATMLSYNPRLFKDLKAVEKSSENFFLFNDSPLALSGPVKFPNIAPQEFEWLKEKNAVVLHRYLRAQEDGTLVREDVVIRPPSLRYEHVERIKSACDRHSLAVIVKIIVKKDEANLAMEKTGELGTAVQHRFIHPDRTVNDSDIQNLVSGLRVLAFESTLETFDPGGYFSSYIVSHLVKPSREINESLKDMLTAGEQNAVLSRLDQGLLFSLAGDYHVVSPPSSHLLIFENGEVRVLNTELEYILDQFIFTARKVIGVLLTREESLRLEKRGASPSQIIEAVKNHPSFAGRWRDGSMFIQAYEALLRKRDLLRDYRKSILVEFIEKDTLRSINMRFEPFFIQSNEMIISQKAVDLYGGRAELFDAIFDRIKNDPEILHFQERREQNFRGQYLLHRANLPRAFIENKSTRTFLHQMARFNGIEKGIYGMLVEVREGVDPPSLIDEQIHLSKAIREWEEALEKERSKTERQAGSIFTKIYYYILGLFGVRKKRREEDSGIISAQQKTVKTLNQEKVQANSKKPAHLLVGPREKKMRIPPAALQAIESVEKTGRGLIWLDEVVDRLASTKYTEDTVGDLMFYDSEERFSEIRAMIKVRRLFLRKEHADDEAWLRERIEILELEKKAMPPSGRSNAQALIDALKAKM